MKTELIPHHLAELCHSTLHHLQRSLLIAGAVWNVLAFIQITVGWESTQTLVNDKYTNVDYPHYQPTEHHLAYRNLHSHRHVSYTSGNHYLPTLIFAHPLLIEDVCSFLLLQVPASHDRPLHGVALGLCHHYVRPLPNLHYNHSLNHFSTEAVIVLLPYLSLYPAIQWGRKWWRERQQRNGLEEVGVVYIHSASGKMETYSDHSDVEILSVDNTL